MLFKITKQYITSEIEASNWTWTFQNYSREWLEQKIRHTSYLGQNHYQDQTSFDGTIRCGVLQKILLQIPKQIETPYILDNIYGD